MVERFSVQNHVFTFHKNGHELFLFVFGNVRKLSTVLWQPKKQLAREKSKYVIETITCFN